MHSQHIHHACLVLVCISFVALLGGDMMGLIAQASILNIKSAN